MTPADQTRGQGPGHTRPIAEAGPFPPDTSPVVLLIDDSPTVAEMVRRALAEEPELTVHYCDDPALAMERAARVRPSVILLDLVMPGANGLDLIKRFREHPPTAEIPILILSSTEKPRTKGDAFAAGASDYLVKPPDKIELLARIRYHARSYSNLLQRNAAYEALRQSRANLERMNRELQRLYSLDGLTGITNRRYFDETLEKEWRRAARDRAVLSLILLDIDCFKDYNDHYGHQAGDDCLRRVALAISNTLRRPADLAARYGGEEFVVLLPGTHGQGATAVAEILRASVEGLGIAHQASPVGQQVTISLGVATFIPSPQASAANLIAAADLALYQAKREGRNRVKRAHDPYHGAQD